MNVWLMAMAKYEQDYIYDWVKYHLNLGIDKIIIIDNQEINSSIHYNQILKEFKDKITFIDFRGFYSIQHQIYNYFYHQIKRKDCDYIGIIDIDEYITGCDNIKQFISNMDDFDVFVLNWKIVPIDGHIYKENKSLEERFKYMKNEKLIPKRENKCFYKTEKPFHIWIHNCWFDNGKIKINDGYFYYKHPKINEDIIIRNADNKILDYIGHFSQEKDRSDKLFIKHYIYKSLEELIIKCTHTNVAFKDDKYHLTRFPDVLKEINNDINLIKQICYKNNIKFQEIY